MSYPEVPIIGIEEYSRPLTFDTGVLEITEESLAEVDAFYRAVLIPQLACAVDGSHPAIPTTAWITALDDRTIITARNKGQLYGVWIVRAGQILYPCANNDYIALIYRKLWDETTKHFDYVWASTSNPVIQGFIKAAVRKDPLPTSPKVNGDRLEWRR